MSKPVKEMMIRDYRDRLAEVEDAMILSLRGIDANRNNAIRKGLLKQDIHVTVVRNALFRKAFEGTSLEPLGKLMTGSTAVAYGAESVVEVAREIVGLIKANPEIELKGAVLDGELFEGAAGVKRLSQFPTRDEAIAKDIAIILGPGRTLMGRVKGPGSALAGIIKSIEEKLEKGETISK